jgi:hypothetical protein
MALYLHVELIDSDHDSRSASRCSAFLIIRTGSADVFSSVKGLSLSMERSANSPRMSKKSSIVCESLSRWAFATRDRLAISGELGCLQNMLLNAWGFYVKTGGEESEGL